MNTEKLRQTIDGVTDKLKHAARDAAARVMHVARDAADLRHVASQDMPNLATASRTVILERDFVAPPAKLFSAWTEPYAIARWWGPEGFTTIDIQMDLRVDGRWANTMVGPDGKRYPSAGEFRQVERPERLLMFDEGKGEPMNGHATKIEVWFEPRGTGTRLHLVHGVFQTVAMRDECKARWSSSLDRLERMLGKK